MKSLLLRGIAASVVMSLASAAGASAAWEQAKPVDNQSSTTQTAGNTGPSTAVADGGNGLSTGFFEQTVGGSNGLYAIRRGPSDASWGAPVPTTYPCGSSCIGPSQPMTAAADGQGSALGATASIANGFSSIFATSWPASAAAPLSMPTDCFTAAISAQWCNLMQGTATDKSFTDPALAFDNGATYSTSGNGNGYAVAGVRQGSPNSPSSPPATTPTDEPIFISTYVNGKWSTPSPIVVTNAPAAITGCTMNPGEICGQEPRLAVSPDGSVVVAFLVSSSPAPGIIQDQVWAAVAPSKAVLNSAGKGFTAAAQISGNAVPIQPAAGAPVGSTPPNYDVAIDPADVATIVDAESQSGFNNQVFARQWDLSLGKPGGQMPISSSSPNEPPASAPRVTAGPSADVTVVWLESSQSSPPPADALMASELVGGHWSPASTITPTVDNPGNPSSSSPTNAPSFWMSEDSTGNVFLVWTNAGSLQDSIRQLAKNWSNVDTVSGVSGATVSTARVSASNVGQADAFVVAGNHLFASRFSGTLPPPRNSAPSATTKPASSVTQTSATLNGIVNPNGQATTWYFQYGTSTSYGRVTPTKDAGSGITDANVAAAVGGLTPGTTYHFRLLATNASGTTNGPDQMFTTGQPPGPPGAATNPATSVTLNGATLNGIVNPDGVSTAYHFQYGTTAAYGQSTPTQDAGSGTTNQSVSAVIGGLTPGTTYHFRISATNSAGTTRGDDMMFTVPFQACNATPRASIKKGQIRASAKGIIVRGGASEPKCQHASPADQSANKVTKVLVAIYQTAPLGKCRFLRRNRTLTPTIPCSSPVELQANGTGNWTLNLRGRIPPGKYVIQAMSVDGFGRQSSQTDATLKRIVVRAKPHKKKKK